MKFTPTDVAGAFIVDIEARTDERGFFARAFCAKEFEAHGLYSEFLQANMSFNHEAGTLRGMHWQDEPHGEVKVVRCTRGVIYDVAVDLRPSSPTYLKWAAVELSAENARAFYIPQGCGHGYLTLTPGAEVHYLVSTYYAPTHDRGALWNDPAFSIEWPQKENLIISDKDQKHPNWIV